MNVYVVGKMFAQIIVILCCPVQDPLMRRIEGAPMVPSAHALLHDQLPHPAARRRNIVFEWIHNFQFRAKKIDVISR